MKLTVSGTYASEIAGLIEKGVFKEIKKGVTIECMSALCGFYQNLKNTDDDMETLILEIPNDIKSNIEGALRESMPCITKEADNLELLCEVAKIFDSVKLKGNDFEFDKKNENIVVKKNETNKNSDNNNKKDNNSSNNNNDKKKKNDSGKSAVAEISTDPKESKENEVESIDDIEDVENPQFAYDDEQLF